LGFTGEMHLNVLNNAMKTLWSKTSVFDAMEGEAGHKWGPSRLGLNAVGHRRCESRTFSSLVPIELVVIPL
jgi:hypothetical protein